PAHLAVPGGRGTGQAAVRVRDHAAQLPTRRDAEQLQGSGPARLRAGGRTQVRRGRSGTRDSDLRVTPLAARQTTQDHRVEPWNQSSTRMALKVFQRLGWPS